MLLEECPNNTDDHTNFTSLDRELQYATWGSGSTLSMGKLLSAKEFPPKLQLPLRRPKSGLNFSIICMSFPLYARYFHSARLVTTTSESTRYLCTNTSLVGPKFHQTFRERYGLCLRWYEGYLKYVCSVPVVFFDNIQSEWEKGSVDSELH